MKTCPICETAYPNECATCTTDGAMLVPTAELDPGTVIRGKYRIVRTLGRGGMGTVYLAEHLLLGRFRALKFMFGQLSHDVRLFNRFRKEAQASIELRHPNIVEVFDLDQADDATPYIAMEFIDGPDLRHLLKHGPLAVSRAISIARGVVHALAAAHARGIVHRDLKPENILLASAYSPHETPKLGDFGIAAMNDAATSVCQTQTLMLTPEYASPEQWRGTPSRDLDGRTDLYALGGVLYEMLTGTKPFNAANPQGWMYQHLHFDPPAPSAFRPELARTPGLDAFVLSLLAKDRDRRIPSAQAAIAALEAITQHATRGVQQPASHPSAAGVAPQPTPPAPVLSQPERIESQRVPTPAPLASAPSTSQRADPPRAIAPACPSPTAAPHVPQPTKSRDSAGSRDPDEPRSGPRTMLLVLSGVLALLILVVVIAFGLPLSTVESMAASLEHPDHSGPALLLHELACGRGSGRACSLLGEAYFNGPGGVSDPTRAAQFYTRACGLGDTPGCFAIASDYELGQGVTPSNSRAEEFYTRGCSLGDPKSCAAASRLRAK